MLLKNEPAGGGSITLRDHPLMTRRSGMKAWPPLWVDTRGPLHQKPKGEIGYLKRVDQHPAIANGLFLWIEHEGLSFVGVMHFDEAAFCGDVRKLLESHLGLAIADIAVLDVSYML